MLDDVTTPRDPNEPGLDRLERFRRIRARLDPAGDPAGAIKAGLYVAPNESVGSSAVSARLAAELAISPASTHLLIGGVGSGKTTELLATAAKLRSIPDMAALYIDVSKGHDIDRMVAGAVLLQVGLAVSRMDPNPPNEEANEEANEESLSFARRRTQELAFGRWADPMEGIPDDEDPVFLSGLLQPPDELEGNVEEASKHVKVLLRAVRHRSHLVVFLDGLDRLTDLRVLEQIIHQDIKALSAMGVGVVLAGPLKAQFGMDHTIAQRFDAIHYQPWIDPRSDGVYHSARVLQRRIPSDAITGEALAEFVFNSGGVLRDLLSLAQSACVEAYIQGRDVIDKVEALYAANAFGRKHMQGLRPAEIEVLKRVMEKGEFIQVSEDDLALLMTRRVLEYRDGGLPRYAVHPTIEPFVASLSKP